MLFLLASLLAPAHAADGDIVDVASKNESFTTLVAAVKAAGLVETLQGEGPFTVFAPTDEAFAALPEGTVDDLLKPENKDKLVAVLTYHVVAGKVASADVKTGDVPSVQGDTIAVKAADGTVMVDGATVTAVDVEATNGVIHVIDQVIMPTMEEPEPEAPETNNIVDVAMGAGDFETLIAAAKAAGLVETLTGEGPYTVFAPTDDAFAKLGDDTIQDLLKPENKEKLAGILTYHVVKGKVMSSDIASGKVPTVQGDDVKVKVKKGTVSLNKSATVVKADIEADNGVIHVIDAVLMP